MLGDCDEDMDKCIAAVRLLLQVAFSDGMGGMSVKAAVMRLKRRKANVRRVRNSHQPTLSFMSTYIHLMSTYVCLVLVCRHMCFMSTLMLFMSTYMFYVDTNVVYVDKDEDEDESA